MGDVKAVISYRVFQCGATLFLDEFQTPPLPVSGVRSDGSRLASLLIS